jgi:hypothetical protein
MQTDETTSRTLKTNLEEFVAELAAAAYVVALRHGVGNPWLDLELDLWHALTDAADEWNREAHGEYNPRGMEREESANRCGMAKSYPIG